MYLKATPTILVIDDDPVPREIFDIVLRRAALSVRTTGTVQGARSCAAAAPDLVLLDLNLNGYDGVDLARELHSSLKKTAIVAVSASSEPSLKERARIAGCSGFISKPINPRTFAADVMQYLPHTTPRACVSRVETKAAPLQLQKHFLDAALEAVQNLAARHNDQLFSDGLLADVSHRWVGTSGIGVLPDVEHLARELETLARAQCLDTADRIREALLSLQEQFEEARRNIHSSVINTNPSHISPR